MNITKLVGFIGFKPMHIRPPKGVDVIVLLKNGKQIKCSTCLITSSDGQGIYFYHKRKSLDEMKATGWALFKDASMQRQADLPNNQ